MATRREGYLVVTGSRYIDGLRGKEQDCVWTRRVGAAQQYGSHRDSADRGGRAGGERTGVREKGPYGIGAEGAIYELVRILDTFRTDLPEPNLTFNIGMIVGGTSIHVDDAGNNAAATGKDNIISPIAYASGDIRTLSNQQTERVEKKMQQIVAKHLPKTNATISFGEGYPAMAPTAQSRALLRILNQANASLGFKTMPELDPMKRGAGDISFVADIIPGLAGIGATGEGAHAPGETIDLSAQPLNSKRDALLMYRLTQIPQTANLTTIAGK